MNAGGSAAGQQRRVGVAVIGAGRWGPNLIRDFHDDARSQLVQVVDINPERLRQVSRRYPEVALGIALEDALDNPAVEAVAIATPATTHFELAEQVISAGRHCFVEKPLTTDTKLAEALCMQADEAAVVLAVGHVFLHNAAVQAVKELIDGGALGEVRYISMVRTNLGPPHIDVSVVWDLASHDLSIADYWLGASPVAASARGGRWITPEREDTVFATVTYPGSRLVHLNVSWLSPLKVRQVVIVGTRKMATIDLMDFAEPLRIYDKGIDPDPDAFVETFGAFHAKVRDGDVTLPAIKMDEPLRAECAHLLDCILSKRRPINDGWSALPVIRTITAIDQSLASMGENVDVIT
ncbi:MAG TPA: Gfo/Idh/MocA family oxidoreductase [Acidimicrobiales bacterium]|nr:Gfo/Idh/MocA family oxidoreductase [Acidimicrobiales bacterium]